MNERICLDHNIAKNSKNLIVIPNWFSDEKSVQSTQVVNNEFLEIKKKYKFIVLYSGNMEKFRISRLFYKVS